MADNNKPVVLITGAAGAIGSAIASKLARNYRVVGFDVSKGGSRTRIFECDLTDDESMAEGFEAFRRTYGDNIAAVIHLAAYFDFTGEDSPLYRSVNVEGTRHLLRGLQDFKVERFIYSGTMLVHEPCEVGERIDEDTPLAPKWPYPRSKAEAERVIKEEHGDIPYLLFHLAGLYDEDNQVPTLSHQIARVYERNLKSHVYAGDLRVGQSVVHIEDMIEAFVRAVDRRHDLPQEATILVGESDALGYGALQDELGRLIHGEESWTTIEAPRPLAKAGAWLDVKTEPVVPDVIDQGEKPFIRPFMIDMADDHYALDTGRAKALLGWESRHWIGDALPQMVESLKDDPVDWYERNGIVQPRWLQAAARKVRNPQRIRERHRKRYEEQHRAFIWAHFVTLMLGCWLLVSPPILGIENTWHMLGERSSGLLVVIASFLALSPKFGLVRWGTALVGLWLLFQPLVFWTPQGAAYINDTFIGMMLMGLSMCSLPTPGISAIAAQSGPSVPPGWRICPSSWFQRIPIIALALVGLFFSMFLCSYQLGHIDQVWEPFFRGTLAGKNGTEQIITSRVSEAWPIPDAGLGAVTYALEIITGLVGTSRRWRTIPWLVILFGILIVPLGIVSVTFIIIQPIVIGTWCTLCLVGAAAMLVQIPYSLDELVATCQFLNRRRKAGANLIRIFFSGDTDDGRFERLEDDFAQPPSRILREILVGGVGLPWNLCLCLAIGVWLLFTRLTLGAEGAMANADHLIGSLIITVTIAAAAEVVRVVRYLNILLGAALLVTPFLFDAGWIAAAISVVCGLAVIAATPRRGPIAGSYGTVDRFIV